jgi:hypothetical protein
MMRGRAIRWLAIASVALCASWCAAQEQHLELGGFGSYQKYDRVGFPQNAFGLGGRLDVNFTKYLQIELESSYDFKHAEVNFTSTSATALLTQSKLGVLHGNAGLKLQSPGGSFFFFLKGGANRFDEEITATTASGFPTTSTITSGTSNSFAKGVLYPGGGVGFHAGPLGIRIDAGDEIYWDHGARHNLRVTFGPTFRF